MSGVAATLIWTLAVEALGLLALPLTLRLFRHFPDRGWGLGKLLGWALLGYPVWLGASVGLTRFTLPPLLAALALGAACAAVAAYRWRGELRAVLHGAGPAIAVSEGIFLLAGAYFLALRAANPDLWHTSWGGEKPMELAHLNAILRSAQFPPHDPWFAGGTLNYYYYGQYLVAVLVKLTGVPVEIAFNLAMPTISALVAGAAFSVAAALAQLALRGRSGASPLAFGALGALLFVGVGNLAGVGEVVGRLRAGDRRPPPFAYFWDSSRAIAGAITEFPYFTQAWADLHAHAIALPFTILAVGLVVALVSGEGRGAKSVERDVPSPDASRLAPYACCLALVLGGLACTNAWDVPVYLALAGAGVFLASGGGMVTSLPGPLAVSRGSRSPTGVGDGEGVTRSGAGGVLVGARGSASGLGRGGSPTRPRGVAGNDTDAPDDRWIGRAPGGDYPHSSRPHARRVGDPPPPQTAVSPNGHVIATRGRGRGVVAAVVRPLAVAVAGMAAMGAGAYLLYLPFFRNFAAQFSSPSRTRVPTPLDQYLDHFGLFVAVAVATLAAGFLVLGRGRAWFCVVAGGVAIGGALVGLRATALTAWLATRTPFFADEVPLSGVPVAGAGTAAALLAALAALLAALWLLARGEPGLRLSLTLLLAAVGVTLGPEVIFLGDDLLGTDLERMNTVFKFSFQGWTLYALGGVGAVAWLWGAAPRWSAAPFAQLRGTSRGRAALVARVAVVGGLALLLVASLVYPVAATPARLAERFPPPARLGPTLDGYRWMEYGVMPRCEACTIADGGAISFADDLAAIRWLNETIAGTPVIAEASVGAWRGNGSRFANATGLPTLLGWDHHQAQQRPVAAVATRAAEVQTLYGSRDEGEKLGILRRHRVEYVIVGAIERGWHLSPAPGHAWAAPEGLAVLEGLAGRALAPVFRSGDTVIYRVLPEGTAGSAAGARARR